MARPFQKDLKIDYNSNTGERVSLSLSGTGDITLVEGHSKLAEQLLRAIVNDQSLIRKSINSTAVTTRSLTTLFNLILRSFKINQATETNRLDDTFSGFVIYRKAVGIDEGFEKISVENVIYSYTDIDVTNGFEYTYGISKIYSNVYISNFVDQFTVTPSRFITNKKMQIGTASVIMPDNGQVKIYVDYDRYYRGSEILDKILNVNVQQDQTEPRRYIVQIQVQDYNGDKVSIASARIDPTK